MMEVIASQTCQNNLLHGSLINMSPISYLPVCSVQTVVAYNDRFIAGAFEMSFAILSIECSILRYKAPSEKNME